MNAPDSRIPVVFGTLADAAADDALLIDGAATAPAGRAVARVAKGAGPHGAGCNCCVSRGGAAAAMAALFVARGRGEVAFFPRLLVALDAAGEAAVRAALAGDRLVAGRYRAEASTASSGRCAAGARSASASG
jgi:hypothetical protein